MAERPVAVVTGASSGIGQATARQLAAAGYRVFGASRTAPARDGSGIEHVVLDVRDDASVATASPGSLIETAGRIDVLVNSAGHLCAGAVEEVPVTEARAQFETNYFGVVRMTAAVLPHMREHRAARARLRRDGRGRAQRTGTRDRRPQDRVDRRRPAPPLRNKITKEAVLVPLLRRLLPEGAFEAGVRRNFKLQNWRQPRAADAEPGLVAYRST